MDFLDYNSTQDSLLKRKGGSYLTVSHLNISLQAITTLASRLASSRATSFPIPVLAPVTITTLSVNFSFPSYFLPPL